MRVLIISFGLFLCSQSLFAQHLNEVRDKLVDGLYYSMEEFLTNSPSVLLDTLAPEIKDYLRHKKCVDYDFLENQKAIRKAYVTDSWGMCIDGVPYIHFDEKGSFINLKTNLYCYQRFFMLGRLCVFYTMPDSYMDTMNNSGMVSMPNSANKNVKQYVLDIETGKFYNLAKRYNDIRQIIQQDEQFRLSIKRKEILYYIALYNKKYPIEFDNK